MEDEQAPTSEVIHTKGEITPNKSYEDTLIEAFKHREERAFWAMVIIGVTIVKPEYHNVWIFGFLGIFGAFQLNYMYLLREMASGKRSGKSPLSVRKTGVAGEKAIIMSDIRSGVVGNAAWWIIGLIALFVWTQTGLKEKLFNNFESNRAVVEQEVITENIHNDLEVPTDTIVEQEKP